MKNNKRIFKTAFYTGLLVLTLSCSTNDTAPTAPTPPSTSADIIQIKVGTEGFAIKAPAADGTATLANAPITIQKASASLAVVAEVSAGARVSAPESLTSVDFSESKTVTISVTAADGTTVKKYSFVITPYETTNNPYGIYTPSHLSNIRNNDQLSYKLMNDITLPNTAGYDDATDIAGMGITDYSTAGWLPIVISNNYFNGTLDGNGKIISGLSINRPTTDNVGLFGKAGGNIKNLGVHILTTGSVRGQKSVGGLVGYSENATISNCYTKGAVIGVEEVGGLSGLNYYGTIENCYSTATVTGTGVSIGGLVGYDFTGNAEHTTFKNCYATGAVSGPAGKTGGLIGKVESGTPVLNCFWDTASTQQPSSALGTGKTTAQMKVATPYDATWTADNWTFTDGQYPKLVGVGGQE